jgi:hypothetical protein
LAETYVRLGFAGWLLVFVVPPILASVARDFVTLAGRLVDEAEVSIQGEERRASVQVDEASPTSVETKPRAGTARGAPRDDVLQCAVQRDDSNSGSSGRT